MASNCPIDNAAAAYRWALEQPDEMDALLNAYNAMCSDALRLELFMIGADLLKGSSSRPVLFASAEDGDQATITVTGDEVAEDKK